MFNSEISEVGSLDFPSFTGLRIMMMPFRLDDVESTIPDFASSWRQPTLDLVKLAPIKTGVAYLTIDEASVLAGQTHRRPGLHVDGVGPDGKAGAWSAKYASNGMFTAASHVGCRGWVGEFSSAPTANGDCSQLAGECEGKVEIIMQAGKIYSCGSLAVHEALPMVVDTDRQFVRLSMPSTAPWYEGYTKNPLGISPEGPIHPPRREFMNYRP